MKYLLLVVCIALLPFSGVMAQETSKQVKEKLEITIRESDNPDVYIDGKKYEYSIIDLLDTDKIESIDVLKGEKALKEYNAPNGVLLIKTKSEKEAQIKLRNSNGTVDGSDDPLVIIDGKVADKGMLEKLSADDIESLFVIKGENAIKNYYGSAAEEAKKYNRSALNGVIVVETKFTIIANEKPEKKKE